MRTLTPLRLLAAAALAAAGCGGPPAYVPVTGTVTLDGKPLADAEVTFVPDPTRGTKGDNASGFTDAQGRFSLRTARANRDGAAPGFYRVVVTDISGIPDLTAPVQVAGAGVGDVPKAPAGPKRPRVPPAYTDAGETPLRDVEVKRDGPALTLDVKSSPR